MKNLLILIFAIVLVATSCSKYTDGYEFSPNSPVESNPALLTTVIEVATFSHYGGQLGRLSSMLTQQTTGVQLQALEATNYSILEGDNNNEWNSLYSATNDCNILINIAGEANPYYRGIGRILKVMNLALITDIWGDVPNQEANQGSLGEANWNPAYDAQELIYADMQNLLDAAIIDLGKTAGDNAILPGSDDIVYGGAANAWLAAAYALKARYYNHLSKRNPAGSATDALTALTDAYNAGFTSPASDLNAIFPGDGNSLNQWYAFNTNRANYIKLSKSFVDLLVAISDPRLPFYAALDDNDSYSGTEVGAEDVTTSDVGAYFASPTAPSPMLTYVEAKFIEAEAAFRSNDLVRAAAAHNEAIQAHVLKVTGSAAPQAYIDAQANEDASSITLEKIMTHKYVAMFTQPEVWTDWRRTNIPNLTPNPEGVANNVLEIPRRLPTPQDERLYNTSAIVISDVTQKVWWDQ